MVELDLAVLVITVPPPGWGVGGWKQKRNEKKRIEGIRSESEMPFVQELCASPLITVLIHCGTPAAHFQYMCIKCKWKWDFPGDPVVKTPCSQCRGHRFHPWSGN